jgi:hypothetical protein
LLNLSNKERLFLHAIQLSLKKEFLKKNLIFLNLICNKNQSAADTSDVSSSQIQIGDPDESYITSDATLSDEKEEIDLYCNSDLYCKICKIYFSTQHILKNHCVHTHGEGDITVPTIECTICSGRFVSSKSLKIHQNQVHETNMPECHLCKYKFTRIKSLNNHMKNRKWFIFSENLSPRIFFAIFTRTKYH